MVKVYRRCLSNRRWTSVDFSGCVLSSGEQQVLLIVSLQAIITGSSISNTSLEQEVNIIYESFTSEILQHSSCVGTVERDCPVQWRINSNNFISHNTASDSGPVLTTSVEGVIHNCRTGIGWRTGECVLQ